jgi:Na+/melibiose symporter-like transporter
MRVGYSRLLTAAVVGSGLAPVLVWVASQYLFQYWATHQVYFGFQFLYILAAVLYIAAFVATYLKNHHEVRLRVVAASQAAPAQAAVQRE